MNNYELLDAVGGVDPKLISEAAHDMPKKSRSFLRAALPAAACLCLALGVFAAVKLIGGSVDKTDDPKAAMNGENAVASVTATDPAVPASADPTEAPSGMETAFPDYQGSWSFLTDNGANAPGTDFKAVTFISSYPGEFNTEHPLLCAGDVCLSPALRAALDEYGSHDEGGHEIIYRVSVELYYDICQVSPWLGEAPFEGVASEAKRLFDEAGIISVQEHLQNDNTGESTWAFHLHATAEQLLNFPASSQYGYYIKLYGEGYDGALATDAPVSFSGANSGS